MVQEMKIYVDAAARGNPGKSGIGVVVCDHSEVVVAKLSEYIGQATNNVAEYTALIYALLEALILGAKRVSVFSDSELVVKQISGEYAVKNEELKRLRKQIEHLRKGFKELNITFIRREENKPADKLANQAIDDAS